MAVCQRMGKQRKKERNETDTRSFRGTTGLHIFTEIAPPCKMLDNCDNSWLGKQDFIALILKLRSSLKISACL